MIPRVSGRRLSVRGIVPLLLLGLGPGFGSSTSVVAQAASGFEWQYSTPEEQGIDSAQIARMLAQIQRERIAIQSFLLVRHGKIVAEAYGYPYTANARHVMYSTSKSFTSTLVGIAIDRGLISGVDARIADLFRGVATRPVAERMSQMTLHHLLSMATGHASDTTNRITATLDWAKTFMELPVEEAPGSRFVYNSGASYMLAAAVQRTVGMTAAEFAQQNLFGPLGITDYTWDRSPTNVITGGWGLSLRPLDMARFGLLYLHKGNWNGQQIVSESWVDQASRRQVSNGTAGFWGSGYGYQFWLNDFGGYRADGAFGQYIFILPDHDTVAVFTSNLQSDTEIPGRFIRQYLLPAMQPGEPLTANPRGNAVIRRAAAALEAVPTTSAAAPSFTTLPENRTVLAGETVVLAASASGTPAPAYQWYRNELPIGGATSATLTIASATTADAGDYMVIARNPSGALASAPATLAVRSAPVVLESPVSLTAALNGDADFQVRAAGGELTYEWRRNGAVISGATASTLSLRNLTTADAGDYAVMVSNPRGSAPSATARLTVGEASPRARLVNLSARGWAAAENETLIVGFVIAGTERTSGLPVLLRGVGPSLVPLGVPAAMDDPATILFVDGVAAATNSEWRGDAALGAIGARVGAFELPARGADSAMLRVLRPRAYTMHIQSSLPDRSGIVQAECYDTAGLLPTESPRLVNLSARARVGAGDETLIGGFVIRGSGEQRILIRGVGPTLVSQQVSGVMEDPVITLYAGNRVLGQNDDWGGTTELHAAFTTTGAFELPADSRDAALLVNLRDGVYSVHVTGKGGASGVALVELYALP